LFAEFATLEDSTSPDTEQIDIVTNLFAFLITTKKITTWNHVLANNSWVKLGPVSFGDSYHLEIWNWKSGVNSRWGFLFQWIVLHNSLLVFVQQFVSFWWKIAEDGMMILSIHYASRKRYQFPRKEVWPFEIWEPYIDTSDFVRGVEADADTSQISSNVEEKNRSECKSFPNLPRVLHFVIFTGLDLGWIRIWRQNWLSKRAKNKIAKPPEKKSLKK
jgi:hypothetical protein